ncbi:MAG: Ig domain-containing protein [Oscillibacter sp.]|nr:Ig domain-containing protein [Oscillibacter sp.]
MIVGEEQRISATVSPENATNQEISWSSSEPSVASVSGGLVKANGEGDAIITAKSGAHQATCNVKVSPIPPKVIEVTEVRLNRNSAEIKSGGEPLQLSATVLPENATIGLTA